MSQKKPRLQNHELVLSILFYVSLCFCCPSNTVKALKEMLKCCEINDDIGHVVPVVKL